MSQIDKIKGMLFGACLGDAIGAQHERDTNEYNGYIYTDKVSFKNFKLGQVTDDSEMLFALSSSIFDNQNKKYNEINAIQAYKDWYMSKPIDIGNNTRYILQKDVQYIQQKHETNSESNGCLMRACILSLMSEEDAINDCKLTNNNSLCIKACQIYHRLLRSLIFNEKIEDIDEIITSNALIKNIFNDAKMKRDRNLTVHKGWIIHALYCAVYFYVNDVNTFQEGIDWIIGKHLDSDTDTNACVAGAVLGAKIGYEKMIQEEKTSQNITSMINSSSKRPEKYKPSYMIPLILRLVVEVHLAT